MDDDQNPDRLMSEPPTNTSADGSPTRAEVHPDGAGEAPASPAQHIDPAALQRVEEVKHSEIGISTLLNRLKQSVASAKVGRELSDDTQHCSQADRKSRNLLLF